MKKIIAFFVISSILFSACEREQLDFEGPALQDLFGEFGILEDLSVSQSEVDFGTGEMVHFEASFTKSLDWVIEITGQNSGAVKQITGFSNAIDATNSSWPGDATILPIFGQEPCSVVLSFTAEEETQNASLSITSVKSNVGYLISDFEDGFNQEWNQFAQSGANMSFGIRDEFQSGQGNFYFDMGGEVPWDWLIGLLDIPASAYGETTFPLTGSADDLYFNVMIYKPDSIINELILFQFREDEDLDGFHSSQSEDMYSIEISNQNLEPGWQLISIPYSETLSLVNGAPAPANGNSIHDPDKIHMISVLMLADPNSGYSRTAMDYMIFTTNGPLRP